MLHLQVLLNTNVRFGGNAYANTGDFITLSADDFARVLQRYPKVN